MKKRISNMLCLLSFLLSGIIIFNNSFEPSNSFNHFLQPTPEYKSELFFTDMESASEQSYLGTKGIHQENIINSESIRSSFKKDESRKDIEFDGVVAHFRIKAYAISVSLLDKSVVNSQRFQYLFLRKLLI